MNYKKINEDVLKDIYNKGTKKFKNIMVAEYNERIAIIYKTHIFLIPKDDFHIKKEINNINVYKFFQNIKEEELLELPFVEEVGDLDCKVFADEKGKQYYIDYNIYTAFKERNNKYNKYTFYTEKEKAPIYVSLC